MDSQAWQVALLVLFAVLTGAALPLAIQLWRTLASYRRFMDAAGPRLNAALDDVHEASRLIREVRTSVRVAAALGAAVAPTAAAFVHSLRSDTSNGHHDASSVAAAPTEKESDHG